MTNYTYHLALFYLAGDILKNRVVYLIAKVNMVELDIAIYVKVNAVLRVLNVGLFL